MQETVPETSKISPFLVFYMIISMQIGVGVLGFQRMVSKYAAQDAWISVLIAGTFLHIILWMMYKIAEAVDGDIVTAHMFIAGKIGGKIISSLFILYFLVYSLTVLRSYFEVVQAWMFPDLGLFWFTLAFLLLCIYIIYGGFRTVVGIAFYGVILPAYLFFIFVFNFRYTEFGHLLPVLNTPVKDILLGSYYTTFSFVGLENLLFFFPFIKEPQKSKKWAHLALLTTTFIYTALMTITIAYFSNEQIQKTIWATLSMWKIVNLPFVERFEYVGISSWSLVILPNVCISMWISSRLMKRIFNLQQRKGVLFIAVIILIVIGYFNSREKISLLIHYTEIIGAFMVYLYIPILLMAIKIIKKVKKK